MRLFGVGFTWTYGHQTGPGLAWQPGSAWTCLDTVHHVKTGKRTASCTLSRCRVPQVTTSYNAPPALTCLSLGYPQAGPPKNCPHQRGPPTSCTKTLTKPLPYLQLPGSYYVLGAVR